MAETIERAARALVRLAAAGGLLVAACVANAHALSEIQPDATQQQEGSDDGGAIERLPLPAPESVPASPPSVPLPHPIRPPAAGAGVDVLDGEPDDTDDAMHDPARPDVDPDSPPPEIFYDLSKLPEPVRRMHRLIVEATKSGDIEKLRPLLGTGDGMTQLSLGGGVDGDAIEFLKLNSGDEEGHEILAILEEVLEAGYVHLDAGTPKELYVWPYFFAMPLEKLTPPQRVELFRIITAGDYEDMKSYGAYVFYRVGITPEGRWLFFVSGE